MWKVKKAWSKLSSRKLQVAKPYFSDLLMSPINLAAKRAAFNSGNNLV